MQLRYSYRIHPAPGQCIALARAFGCARTVFNDALAARRTAHANGDPYPTSAVLSKTLITLAKQTPERVWLCNAPTGVLQQSLRDLDRAYRNFFDSLKSVRKGVKIAPPRFKSRRDSRQAIRFTRSDRFTIKGNGRLRLPKVGDVKVTWTRALPAEPSSVTVIRDATGRFFCSFVVEAGDQPLPEAEAETGIDLGLTHFAILSNGEKITNPRLLRKAEHRLKARLRDLARKTKGSANRAKARVKVARAHAKVRDARSDFLHKLSARLVGENQTIVVEKLNTRGLARTRLAKSIHDAGWSMFVNMLEYKSARAGRVFTRVDPAYTSQSCSVCGVLDGPKPLHVREWSCTACGTEHDRDVNAARNILAAGRAERLNACRDQVRPGHLRAQVEETGTHRRALGRQAEACTEGAVGIPAL